MITNLTILCDTGITTNFRDVKKLAVQDGFITFTYENDVYRFNVNKVVYYTLHFENFVNLNEGEN